MGTFPLDTNIVSSGNIPSILMTGYLLGTFPLDTAGMAVYTWIDDPSAQFSLTNVSKEVSHFDRDRQVTVSYGTNYF